jgi:uncharacterized protein (TIGR04255 family)
MVLPLPIWCDSYSMSARPAQLPEFEAPPVSEVALSVEFSPLENWRSPHAGLYWSRINQAYPQSETQPPLPSQIEKFGEEFWVQPSLRVEFVNPDISRFWFIADPPTKLIQVQRDRFVVNWRRVKGDETYPRYFDEMRPRFEREWTDFKAFVSERKVGTIAILQCEVTYRNEFLQGKEWNAFPESLALFAPWWQEGTDGFLPQPESLAVAGSFRMPGERGRLHFSAHHIRRQLDQKEAIQFQLVARGRPTSDSNADILSWMDIGHEWAVRGFADLTSKQAHQQWKRKS